MAVLTFDTNNDEELLAKVGVSHVDYEGAKNNLDAEIPAWDFDAVKDAALKVWEKELNVINAEGGSGDEKTIFYNS